MTISERPDSLLPGHAAATLADPSEVSLCRPAPRLSSRDLLGDRVEVEIDHDGVIYRLRLTSLGKLILTK